MIKELNFQKGTYLAFVLSDESREQLMKISEPTFSKVICHHITIVQGISAGQLSKYQAAHQVDPVVEVTGICIGENVECFTVTIDGDSRRRFGDGALYHVTLSVEPPAKPVDSNKLLKNPNARHVSFPTPIKVSGTFELVKQ